MRQGQKIGEQGRGIAGQPVSFRADSSFKFFSQIFSTREPANAVRGTTGAGSGDNFKIPASRGDAARQNPRGF